MNKSYIYKLTLKKDVGNGKFPKGSIYIGQHNGKNNKYFGSGTFITKILKSRGREVFDREILCEGKFNRKLIDQLEVHYIRLYNSERKNNTLGLNLTAGGFGCSNHNAPKGEKSVHSKLKRKDILDITDYYLSGKVSVEEISGMYDVNRTCIQGILKGRTWSHVERVLIKEDLRCSEVTAKKKHYYSDELCQSIIDEFVEENYSRVYLSKKFNISRQLTEKIINGAKRPYLDRSKIKNRLRLSGKLSNSECFELYEDKINNKMDTCELTLKYSIGRQHIRITINKVEKYLKTNNN